MAKGFPEEALDKIHSQVMYESLERKLGQVQFDYAIARNALKEATRAGSDDSIAWLNELMPVLGKWADRLKAEKKNYKMIDTEDE
jgi:hypothetical protein